PTLPHSRLLWSGLGLRALWRRGLESQSSGWLHWLEWPAAPAAALTDSQHEPLSHSVSGAGASSGQSYSRHNPAALALRLAKQIPDRALPGGNFRGARTLFWDLLQSSQLVAGGFDLRSQPLRSGQHATGAHQRHLSLCALR